MCIMMCNDLDLISIPKPGLGMSPQEVDNKTS